MIGAHPAERQPKCLQLQGKRAVQGMAFPLTQPWAFEIIHPV